MSKQQNSITTKRHTCKESNTEIKSIKHLNYLKQLKCHCHVMILSKLFTHICHHYQFLFLGTIINLGATAPIKFVAEKIAQYMLI